MGGHTEGGGGSGGGGRSFKMMRVLVIAKMKSFGEKIFGRRGTRGGEGDWMSGRHPHLCCHLLFSRK